MTENQSSFEFTVRDAVNSDIDKIYEIECLSFSNPWSREDFISNLGDSYIFSVICESETVIGYAIVSVTPPEGELYNIAVLSEYRGTGAAHLLLGTAFEAARKRNVETVYLEVRESSLRARSYYKKEGFTELGLRKNYYKNPTENAVLMTKNI